LCSGSPGERLADLPEPGDEEATDMPQPRGAQQIDEEVARLKAQAAALHRAAQRAVEANQADVGGRIDASARAAAAARAEAKAASDQATTEHEDAARLEAEAAAGTDPDDGALLRSSAAGHTRRAEAAHRSAQEAADRAATHEGQAQALEATANTEGLMHRRAIEDAADRLDAKIDLLEQAAATDRRRDFETQADAHVIEVPAKELKHGPHIEVTRLLEQADAIQPDFGAVDPAVLREAGIPLAQIPGSELMDPSAEGAGAAPGAGALDTQAAQLRAQAAVLHSAALEAVTSERTKLQSELNDLQRAASAARHGAQEAAQQADTQTEQAKSNLETAQRLDKQASATSDQIAAESLREDAQAYRAAAAASTELAQRAQQAMVDETVRAAELEQRARNLDEAPTPPDFPPRVLEAAADQLDDKARLLAEAAQSQREAERYQATGDVGGAAGSASYTRYLLEQAAAIEVDVSQIDPAIRSQAGLDDAAGQEPVDPLAVIGADPSVDLIDDVPDGTDDLVGATAPAEVPAAAHEPTAAADTADPDLGDLSAFSDLGVAEPAVDPIEVAPSSDDGILDGDPLELVEPPDLIDQPADDLVPAGPGDLDSDFIDL
jgi:hypothetical protein